LIRIGQDLCHGDGLGAVMFQDNQFKSPGEMSVLDGPHQDRLTLSSCSTEAADILLAQHVHPPFPLFSSLRSCVGACLTL